MPIKVTCPSCQKGINVPDPYAGKRVKCQGCQTMIAVPAAAPEPTVVGKATPSSPLPDAIEPTAPSGKKSRFPKPVILVGTGCAAMVMLLIAGLVVITIVWGWGAGHPLKDAKPGDWARYDMTAATDGGSEKATLLVEVLSNDGKRARLRMTTTTPGRWGSQTQENEMEVDLSKSQDELALSMLTEGIPGVKKDGVKIERGKKTKETVQAAGQKFSCIVTPYTVTMSGPDGATITATGKTWTSKSAPVAGIVKEEGNVTIIAKTKSETVTLTQTLVASGNDPSSAKTR